MFGPRYFGARYFGSRYFGTGALGAPAAGTLTYLTQRTDAGDLTEYTFTSTSFGDEASDRIILVVVSSRGTGVDVTSVTIGGVTATEIVQAGVGQGFGSAIYGAVVPTGTSGTLVVTFSGSPLRCVANVFRATGISLTPIQTRTGSSSTLSTTLEIPAGGVALGGGQGFNIDPNTYTWTGLTKRSDGVLESMRHTTASGEFATAETALAITCTPSVTLSTPSYVLASFGPAGGVAPSVGSSEGSAVTSGVGSSVFSGVGFSEGSAVTSGVSVSLASTGSSEGSAVASGVGSSVLSSTGSSEGTSVASGVSVALGVTSEFSANLAVLSGGGVPRASVTSEVFVAKGPSALEATSTSCTAAAWVTIPGGLGFTSSTYTIVAFGVPGEPDAALILDFTHHPYVRVSVRRPSVTQVFLQRTSGIPTDTPILVVGVRDEGTLRISINGDAFSSSAIAGSGAINATETWIGGDTGVAWPHNSSIGQTHRVMTWDRALTIGEVETLHAAGVSGTLGGNLVSSPSAWIEPYAWRFSDQVDTNRSFRFDHFPATGFTRPANGTFIGEVHREQFVTTLTSSGRTWSGTYATAPLLRDPIRRLSFGGTGSLASPGSLISGRTTWDWLAQGHFPVPPAEEQYYAEHAPDGSGVRITVKSDGKVAITYLDSLGDTIDEVVSSESIYERREILGRTGTNTSEPALNHDFVRCQLDIGPGHDFTANDLARIEGDANFPDEFVITETDSAAGWVRFLIFGGHDLTLPTVGATLAATGRIGLPINTNDSDAGFAADRKGWNAEPRWLALRISRRGDDITIAARGRVIGSTSTTSLTPGPTDGVTSYLGGSPGSPLAIASGDLIGLMTGDGWTAAEIAAYELRSSILMTNQDAELDRRSTFYLAELPGLDREWLAYYPVELVVRDKATGVVIGDPHEVTGQSYGRQTGLTAYIQFGSRDLAAVKAYDCELTVFDRPFNANFSARTPAVLAHGHAATVTRRSLDERWVTKYVDPLHPNAAGGFNTGTDPNVPLLNLTSAARACGIYTRVILAPVDFVALGRANGGIGFDHGSSLAQRLTGPTRMETLVPETFAQVGCWRIRSGSYAFAMRGLSSITESTYESFVTGVGNTAINSPGGPSDLLDIAECVIRSNAAHGRSFGSASLGAIRWGGRDRIEHYPSATLAPTNTYGYFNDHPLQYSAFTRILLAIQNDNAQHPLRTMGSHALTLAHWPVRTTTNYGNYLRALTLRQQASLTNVHDMAFQGWNLRNARYTWSTLPSDGWRVERADLHHFEIDAHSGMVIAHSSFRTSSNFKALPTGAPHYETLRRNIAVGLRFHSVNAAAPARFDVWLTSGPNENRQAVSGSYEPASAPAVALAEPAGDGRVAFQANGYPQGGTTTGPIRLAWQRRPSAGSDWVTLEGIGSAYGTDWPSEGTWVYRTAVYDADANLIATGDESDPVTTNLSPPISGSSAGTSSAVGVGLSVAVASGSSSGSAVASGSGVLLVSAAGSAAGEASAAAVGIGLEQGTATGDADGSATASGVGRSVALTAGLSLGSSGASAFPLLPTLSVGVASGSAVVSGRSFAPTGIPTRLRSIVVLASGQADPLRSFVVIVDEVIGP